MACAHKTPQPPSPVRIGQPAPAALRQRYSGTYVYAGGDAERASVSAAVNRAVEQMPFFSRGFARSALMERAEVRDFYAISFDDQGNLSILSPNEFPEVSPSDGTPVRITNRFGDQTELSQQFVDGVLVQRGRSDRGGGTTTFELRPDDQTLLVHRVMESSQLPQPVDYALTYKRQ
ncbi:MAG TPA: hypothetical protein VKE49_06535 [Myxococcaceae bacterium]|nr:hypothetical protein [Myxococcaceae bacterium]